MSFIEIVYGNGKKILAGQTCLFMKNRMINYTITKDRNKLLSFVIESYFQLCFCCSYN